jgi:hypothetical protein
MDPETTVVVEPEGTAEGDDSAAAADAARAEASASAAAEAAALAIVTADAAAAAAEADAAASVRNIEGELDQCRDQLSNVIRSQDAFSVAVADLQSTMAAIQTEQQSILSRLLPEPESQPNPAAEPSDEAVAEAEPATEPEPPARRRVHRWI